MRAKSLCPRFRIGKTETAYSRTQNDMKGIQFGSVAAIAAFSIPLLTPIAGAQRKAETAVVVTSPRAVEVQLNGRRFAVGLAVASSASSEEVFVPIAALARALDGPSGPIRRPRSSSRLRLDGHRLVAVAHGGCDECHARVTRLFVISARVRAVDGTPALPLTDLVAAFEGRLEVDSARTLYGIHAGQCTWCILGPR